VKDRHNYLSSLLARLGEGQLVRALLQAVGDDVMIVDAQGRICCCGSRVAARLGYAANDLIGSPSVKLLAPESGTTDTGGLPTARRFQVTCLRKDGAAIGCSGRTLPLDDTQGHSVGSLCVFDGAPHIGMLEDLDLHPHLSNAQTLVLEESNHRVRNNLAMICALLDMEILHAPEGERQRLLVSLARTRSLALPHNLVEEASGEVEVGMLTHAVVDSTRSLFAQVDATVNVTSTAPVRLSCRRATYLALALTELMVHLMHCAVGHVAHASPVIHIAEDPPGTVSLELTAACNISEPPCEKLAPLSREILVGLVERSLAGRLELSESHPVHAVIAFPLTEKQPVKPV